MGLVPRTEKPRKSQLTQFARQLPAREQLFTQPLHRKTDRKKSHLCLYAGAQIMVKNVEDGNNIFYAIINESLNSHLNH